MRLNDDGSSKGVTYGESASEFLKQLGDHLQIDTNTVDTAWLPTEWRLAPLGYRLVASGHILTAREMAIQLDPFKGWGSMVRQEALSRFGAEMDCRACYPNASSHLIPVHRDVTSRFVTHKDVILHTIGGIWFPTQHP